MSESNTQSSSAAQPSNNDSDSGIVITGGLDSPGQEPESPSATDEEMEPEVEAEPEVEEDESEVEAEPEAEDAVEESENATEEQASEIEAEESEQEADSEASVDEGEAVTDDVAGEEVEKEGASAVDTDSEAEPVGEAESASPKEAVDETEKAEAEAVEAEDASTVSGDEEAGAEAVEDADATEEAEASQEDESVEAGEVNHPPKRLSATVEADELSDFVNNISVLVDECKIRTSPDGLRVRAVDPANVGMVDAELDAEAFEGFDTTTGVLGVDLGRFEEVVSLADSGDLVTMEYDTETRKLHIATNGVEYTLALIDPDSIRQEPEIPDLDLPCSLEVETSDINRGIKAADMVSDHIAFKTERAHSGDQFIIEAEGDTDDVELELSNEDLVSSSIGGDVASLFSLEYMKDIKKALPTTGSVGMEMGDEFPIKIRFSNEEETQDVEFMLAPRINSD
jgi:proliferating cell nuclear antigen